MHTRNKKKNGSVTNKHKEKKKSGREQTNKQTKKGDGSGSDGNENAPLQRVGRGR